MATRSAAPLASSRLARLAQAQRTLVASPEPEEHCELCSNPIPPEHRHLLEIETRDLKCACRPCSVLFDSDAAGAGKYKLVRDRRLRLEDFAMSDVMWEELRIPVDMAFFFHSTPHERVVAYYPGAMGPTESQLELSSWTELEAANPILADLEPDVEALLVNRARGARRQWIVPLDECYALVGLIRTRWRGFSGGKEVWQELDNFFETLDRRAKSATGRS